MNILPLLSPSPETLDELLRVWEKSVRTSHHFLSEADIERFKPLIRNRYFPAVRLFVVQNGEGRIAAFMGLSDDKVEMLFVLPEEQGKGFGRALLEEAYRTHGIRKVDVNEDNTQALRFYLRMGYEVTSRDATDSDGLPFPILHLERK